MIGSVVVQSSRQRPAGVAPAPKTLSARFGLCRQATCDDPYDPLRGIFDYRFCNALHRGVIEHAAQRAQGRAGACPMAFIRWVLVGGLETPPSLSLMKT